MWLRRRAYMWCPGIPVRLDRVIGGDENTYFWCIECVVCQMDAKNGLSARKQSKLAILGALGCVGTATWRGPVGPAPHDGERAAGSLTRGRQLAAPDWSGTVANSISGYLRPEIPLFPSFFVFAPS